MTRDETLRWLANLQAQFGQALRLPLDRSQHSLRAQTEHYADDLVARLAAGPHSSARARMAVYNRQYWFRLFSVLQDEYPLTARLLGMWTFNRYASRFLQAQPPQHYDIQCAAHGFAAFLEAELQAPEPRTPSPARASSATLIEAIRIDSAYREILRAADTPPFTLSTEQAASLPLAQLVAAQTFRLVSESSALLALRKALADDKGEQAVPPPQPHSEPQHWALFTHRHGLGAIALHPLRALLLRNLSEHSVSEALARLEQAATPEQRDLLVKHAQSWLADSVQRGFWSGIRFSKAAREAN